MSFSNNINIEYHISMHLEQIFYNETKIDL